MYINTFKYNVILVFIFILLRCAKNGQSFL